MKKGFFKSLLLAVICGFYTLGATAATSLFSDYGQIQNVQNYSTNPFWTPNSPYNQRLPQPVYVQGADVKTDECIQLVQSMVYAQCMARDNCKNTTLAEIRPEIMVQLSKLPNKNYVSACAGYLDEIFESYVAQYGNALPNRAVAFPTATMPNQNLNNNTGIEIKNPYKQVTPQWQQEIKERSDELERLQQQNGAGSEHLSATAFPTTFEDLSFSERMAVKTKGYEPFKDASAYVIPNFVSEKDGCSGDGNGSDMCKKYAAEKKQPKDKTKPDSEVPEETYQTQDLCAENAVFNLSQRDISVFADVQVHTPQTAKKLAQEYIQCSTEPELKVTDKYTTENNDDFLFVQNSDSQTVHKIQFDDVTESDGLTFGMDTIKALCLVANGTPSTRRCPNTQPACFEHCQEITEKQFAKIRDFVKDNIAAEATNFKGMGSYCYKITYTKSDKKMYYSVFQGRNCKNEIIVDN